MMNDLISRQDAIDAINSIDNLDAKARGGIYFILMGLPSAQPTATWLIRKWGDDAKCSNCGRIFKDVYDMDNHDQYCRHCGTHMKGIKAI